MLKFGSIKEQKLNSPIEQLALVRPVSSGRNMATVVAPLMLTSLVDAFAVIVIYLLVSTQNAGTDLKTDKEIKLPQASHSQVLQPGVNLRVIGDRYIIDDQKLPIQQLTQYLTQLNEKLKTENDKRHGQLIIQADKKAAFKGLSPLLVVAAQSGFENVRFAVVGVEK